MKNKIYKYFFYEFIRYFTTVLFALTAIIWTIQAVNLLDLVIDDGQAFMVYLGYSFLTLPKIFTKLIPFTFLIASVLTILKFEKDNELIVLWTSGLNKIRVVNLVFSISLLIMLIQLILSIFITPQTLNYSRSILKNSELQFVPSLLKEKQFNDTVEGLTIFVDKKEPDGKYKNIFIRDDGNVLTKVSKGTSTIFAKSGFVSSDEKSLILLNGIIQKFENNKSINMITFEKTVLNLSGLSTKSITEPKLQETSTFLIIKCMTTKNVILLNCNTQNENKKDTKIEINKRFGMPLFIPLISLMVCFLLSFSQKTIFGLSRHLYFFLGFVILLSAEITVRYSGNSLNHTLIYYFIPIALIPIFYFILIKKFKYENLY